MKTLRSHFSSLYKLERGCVGVSHSANHYLVRNHLCILMYGSWIGSATDLEATEYEENELKPLSSRISNDQRIVNDLMSYAVQPENSSDDTRKFHEMAIRSLVRRVRRNPERNALDNLIKAIKTKDMETECIRIPRSLDGRMQVRQKKTVPHVLYCQIWRWSDLKSYHEIHGILTCRYAYEMSQSSGEICVNPYHYERIGSTQSLQLRDFQHEDEGYEYQHKLQSPIEPSFTCQIPQATHLTYDRPIYYQRVSNTQSLNHAYSSWARIVYHELKDQCADFHAYTKEIKIDNGTHPFLTNRFCLGHIQNIRRTDKIEGVRCVLGRGIRLMGGFGNTDVHLENLSQSKVFVQSANLNELDKCDQKQIRPILPGEQGKIFDKVSFSLKLQELTHSCDYERVTQMVDDCKIRISFVKGWGSDYRRKTINSCETWIQIELLECLSWLDHVLSHMMAPSGVSSGSDH